ncbi:MAG: hypothetical protein WKF37_01160 [Bryobacteraceae bacterium]
MSSAPTAVRVPRYAYASITAGGVNGRRGLRGFVRGGMGSFKAIAASARSRGAHIRTGASVNQFGSKLDATGVVRRTAMN